MSPQERGRRPTLPPGMEPERIPQWSPPTPNNPYSGLPYAAMPHVDVKKHGPSISTMISVLGVLLTIGAIVFAAGRWSGPLDQIPKMNEKLDQHAVQIQSASDKAAGAEAASQRTETQVNEMQKVLIHIQTYEQGHRR
jgi:hypothetical protein